jgi:hypothetical protein
MNVIAHRGYWKTLGEKNSSEAFLRSFQYGFGIETDIRDALGELCVSHDPPQQDYFSLSSLIEIHRPYSQLPIAINIKADGLAQRLKQQLSRAQITNYFVFDMSIPDMRSYLALGMPVYTRLSEYEEKPALIHKCQGIWLDAFERLWYTEKVIHQYLFEGKKVAVVSEELHGRDPSLQWTMLLSIPEHLLHNLTLCTDWPERAALFFNIPIHEH